ncbi:hypothetical protein JCM5350_002418 [Sporobolomyces pararoseus]
MLLNESTTLYSPRLVLRPYRRWHVPQYHEWMEDPKIREQTASERLSFEEELEMQSSWSLDEDKLTFIVHLRDPSAPSPETDRTGFLSAHNDSRTMLGDVNLFLHSSSSSFEDDAEDGDNPEEEKMTAELEIMLPPSSKNYKPRTGLALETLQLFLSYSSRHLDLKPRQFIAKVGFDNEASLRLFEKMGFVEKKRVEIFREIELDWGGGRGGEEGGEHMWSWEKDMEGWKMGILEDPRDSERD